nr:g-type lectin s-receptor-like serine/threonine-protein kinase [Quercus suber]
MGCFLFSLSFFICCVFLPSFTFSGSFSTHSISPNFTASHFQFHDTRGAFLRSQNGTFKATIDASPPSSKYYFSIVHSATKTINWSANRDRPMSSFDKLSLTVNGVTVTNQTGQTLWSTPQFNSDISAMQLSETGNLVLVDAGNNTLWESFDHPTDTIVMGQRIPIGKSLQSAVIDEDMSVGDYQLEVTDRDVVLQWNKMNYWESSMDPEAVRNSNKAVSLMVMNGTGLYLLASDNSTVVEVALNGLSSFRSGKLGPNGRFSIVRPPTRSDNKWEVEFAGPFEDCDLPLNCKEIGLCTRKPLGGICSCLPEFSYQTYGDTDCMPANSSLSLPSACTAARNGSQLNSSISYIKFGPDMHVRRRYLELADPRLEGGVSSEENEKLVRIALCCLHQDPALRPTMANVVGMLEGGLALSEPRVKSLNFLRAYGQRFTETTTMQGPTSNGAAIATCNSLSYISSQQLSGPR